MCLLGSTPVSTNGQILLTELAQVSNHTLVGGQCLQMPPKDSGPGRQRARSEPHLRRQKMGVFARIKRTLWRLTRARNLTSPDHRRSSSAMGRTPQRIGNQLVEMIAVSRVRVSGMVSALDEQTVAILRGTFTFYMQDAYGVQLRLPACDTYLAGSSTIVLVGPNPTIAQLRRLLGARRAMVQDISGYLLDKDNVLVGEHKLARQAVQSPENLESYDEDGGVPKALLAAIIAVKGPTGSYTRARSIRAHGNRETAETPVNPDTVGAVRHDDTLPSVLLS